MGSSTSAVAFLKSLQVPMALLATVGLDGIPFPKQTKLQDNAIYDYIVVGGGTAGCVVARRLAEDGSNSVLMLEAGDDPPITSLLPPFYDLLPDSHVDWKYNSTPEQYAAAGQGGRTMITAGKMLGGSSSLDHYIYLRGIASDFDKWAKISKSTSWRYENILKYFIKAEHLEDAEILSVYYEYHGTEGEIITEKQTDQFSEMVADYLKSFAEIGYPTVIDLTANVSLGYTEPLFTAHKIRQTPAITYLKPIKHAPNFHVSKNTQVTKIIFEDKVAVGVVAVFKGKEYHFRAKKEIIISAGVFNTPQLLMLSGVGPKEHLELKNIEVIANLPVGDNLRDHVSVTIVQRVKTHPKPIPEVSSYIYSPFQVPLPTIVGSVALEASQTYPDYQSYNSILEHDTFYLTLYCKAFFRHRNDLCDNWERQSKTRDALYTTLSHMQPKSLGNVRLKSSDPFDDPLITTGYYSNMQDLDDMVNYVKDFVKVTNTSYFKSIGAGLIGLDMPDCAHTVSMSDEYWKCYVLTLSCSSYDFCGTCAMGSVVDSRLKLKGFDKIRIVDASVMPTIPRGRIGAVVVMLAEKAADIMLGRA